MQVTTPVSTSTVNFPVVPNSDVVRTVRLPPLRSAGLESLTVVVAAVASVSRKKSPSDGPSGKSDGVSSHRMSLTRTARVVWAPPAPPATYTRR